MIIICLHLIIRQVLLVAVTHLGIMLIAKDSQYKNSSRQILIKKIAINKLIYWQELTKAL